MSRMLNEITDSKSSPEARAERVRRLRNMANLSRQEMCKTGDFKLDTLIGWEVARHGGLTEKGAKRVIHRVAKEGVSCTLDWLLHGIGYNPTVITNFEEIQKSFNKITAPLGDEDKKITKELIFFRENNPDSLELAIQDDSMSPIYCKGEYVAGIRRYKDKIHTLIGLDCIVQPIGGELLLRKILKGPEENKFNLICINHSFETQHSILMNVAVAYAAPVIWHRKKNPK